MTIFNNFLPKALFLSLCIHTAFVCSSLLKHPLNKPKKPKTVEITYKPIVQKNVDVKQHPIRPTQKFDLKNTMDASVEGAIPLKVSREQGLGAMAMAERKPQRIQATPMEHKVTVTPIKSEKMNNPAYIAYNEMVRTRIRDKVYANYSHMGAGSVYLTFIIAANGTLKAAQIIESKTQASKVLKDLSMRSLRESQFPPVYKGMTLPEYTFNIEIQYQIKE